MCILTPRERNPEEKDEEVDPGTDVGHLASEGDRPQGDDKEQVGNVGLDALPMKNLALTRAGEKSLQQMFKSFWELKSLTRKSRR